MTPKIVENTKDSMEDIIINSESNFSLFQTNISKEKIIKLNKEFKKHEKKGYINYFYFIQSMKIVFDEIESINNNISINSNKNNISYDDIYNLFFKRFREIKCILKNDKEVFYLTDIKNENYISTYKALYALIIFLLAKIDLKLKLLFQMTDIDEDGLLSNKEIKYMITTVNHLFTEETNSIKMNSSILSQSLMNIKVENILTELFEGQGDLNNILNRNNNYIDYNTFYNSVIKIKNYKYKIIPLFINFKECLYNKKQESIIKIKSKIKNDFFNISSSFMAEQCKNISNNYLLRKKYSKIDISDIIQPIELDNNNNISSEKTFIKSNMSLKSLMKNYSTILENKNNISSYNFKENESDRFTSTYFKNSKFAFQANFGDIRNLEVEPGIVKILSEEGKKEEDNLTILDSIEIFNDNKKRKSIIYNNNNSFLGKDSLISNKESLKKIIFNHKNNIDTRKSLFNPFTSKFIKKSLENNFNSSRISRPSFHLTKKKFNISNLINENKTKKNKKYENKYKTLEEIKKEIKSEENLFNNESINSINSEMVKESDKAEAFMKRFKHSFLFKKERQKRSSSFLGILYYKKGSLPQILSKEKN